MAYDVEHKVGPHRKIELPVASAIIRDPEFPLAELAKRTGRARSKLK